MGELFGASKEAYERGDGAEAKKLSNEAKALREEKERLHDEAADWIFLRELTFYLFWFLLLLSATMLSCRAWDGVVIT